MKFYFKKAPIQIGDIFEIPLPNNKYAFGQFIYFDQKTAGLIKILDLIASGNQSLHFQQIVNSSPLFPPVYTGVYQAVRKKVWKIIGNAFIKDFNYELFIRELEKLKIGKVPVFKPEEINQFIELKSNPYTILKSSINFPNAPLIKEALESEP